MQAQVLQRAGTLLGHHGNECPVGLVEIVGRFNVNKAHRFALYQKWHHVGILAQHFGYFAGQDSLAALSANVIKTLLAAEAARGGLHGGFKVIKGDDHAIDGRDEAVTRQIAQCHDLGQYALKELAQRAVADPVNVRRGHQYMLQADPVEINRSQVTVGLDG